MREMGQRGDHGTNFTVDSSFQNLIGRLAISLAAVTNLMPGTAEYITPRLKATAIAAAKQCSGSVNQTVCGSEWTNPVYDEKPSLESAMNAVNLFTSILSLPEEPRTELARREIAGIAVGSAAGVALIAAAIFLAVRRRKKRREKAVSDLGYSPCHSDQNQNVMEVPHCSHCGNVSRTELPTSKDEGAPTIRHELHGNDTPIEQHGNFNSQEIIPHRGNQ